MRLTILILLIAFKSFGQTSLPSSGALTMHQIATVMANLGEISPIYTEPGTSYSISFLNGASHLSDKTPPYSISDWYGYSGAGIVYTFNLYAYNSDPNLICSTFGGSPVLYSNYAALNVGSTVYSDNTLTTPAANGAYRYTSSSTSRTITVLSGVVTAVNFCTTGYAYLMNYTSNLITPCISGVNGSNYTSSSLPSSPSSIGYIIYSDPELSIPAPNGQYRVSGNVYYITGGSGIITHYGACP